MASEAQIAANRRNAGKSTGPRSPEGKAKAARNALRHGLTAGQLILAGENQADFLAFYSELVAAHAPIDPVEHGIVERIAMAHWRLRRAWRAEAMAFEAARLTARRRQARELMTGSLMAEAMAKGAEAGDAKRDALAAVRTLSDAALDGEDFPDLDGGQPWPGSIETLQRYETALERTLHRLTLELDRARKNRQERLYHAQCFERAQQETDAAEAAAAAAPPPARSEAAAKRSQSAAGPRAAPPGTAETPPESADSGSSDGAGGEEDVVMTRESRLESGA